MSPSATTKAYSGLSDAVPAGDDHKHDAARKACKFSKPCVFRSTGLSIARFAFLRQADTDTLRTDWSYVRTLASCVPLRVLWFLPRIICPDARMTPDVCRRQARSCHDHGHGHGHASSAPSSHLPACDPDAIDAPTEETTKTHSQSLSHSVVPSLPSSDSTDGSRRRTAAVVTRTHTHTHS